MADHVSTESPGMASLFGGIVNDVRALVRQEIALAKAEILKEWGKAKAAAGAMAAGAALLAVGAVLSCVAAACALHEAAGLPWWASFLTVGGTLALPGAVLVWAGRNKASQVHLVPQQAARDTAENTEATRPAGADVKGTVPTAGPLTAKHPWATLGLSLIAGVAVEVFRARRAARGVPETAAEPPAQPTPEEPGQPRFGEKLSEQFGDELQKLQEMAIVALVGLVREVTKKSIAALADAVEGRMSDAAARLATPPAAQPDEGPAEGSGGSTDQPPPAP